MKKEDINNYENDLSVTKKEKIKYIDYSFWKKRLRKILIPFFIFLILCVAFIFLGIKINVNTNLRYYQTSKLNYKVNLKNNKYYTNKTLDEDMLYISNLLDSVNVDFKYNFKTSDKLDYKYSYSVNADILIYDEPSGNTIYKKSYTLINEETEEKKDSDNFDLDKKIYINYDKYNSLAQKFKSDYGLMAKGKLVVTLNVKVMDTKNIEYKKLNANNQMKVIIPLTEQMVNIKLDYKEINNSDTIVKHTKIKIDNKILFFTGVLFGVLSFFMFVYLLFVLCKIIFKKKTKYDKELARILREYDRVIVETKEHYLVANQEVIDVNSFNELLDARDSIEKPILFSEIIKGKVSEFIVKDELIIYRYCLRAVDLEDKK